jgi:hypothetical protein
MSTRVTHCTEEEYSFCLSHLWRRRQGWRPLFICFRGPAGVPFFVVPVFTLLGVWLFSRRPPRLADADATLFRHATVMRAECSLGSYGMGGPGFVGLQLKLRSGRHVWVVFTVWGAAGWLTIGEDLLAEGYPESRRHELWDARRFRSLADLVGATLTDLRLEHDLAELTFGDANNLYPLRLRHDSSTLPVHAGSKEPKRFEPDEDMRDAVVVSEKAALWVDA